MNINVLEKEIVKAIEVEEELSLLLISKQEEKAMEDNFTNLKSFVRGKMKKFKEEL